MGLLISWIDEKLTQIPSECVLYGGIYDIIEEKSPTAILNNLDCLITALKEKNSAMKVHVCQLVPPPTTEEIQAKILDYNEHLTKWGEANGINIIKTAPIFVLSTGEVDDMCFDTENNSRPVLNRLGVIKLLSTIKKQYPDFHLCTDWEEVKKNINKKNITTYQAQRKDKRTADSDNATLANRTENVDQHRPSSQERQAAPRNHNRPSQQDRPYALNASTHTATQNSSPASLPRPLFKRRAPYHYIPTRSATRGSETGWSNEDGASTDAAAARRNLAPSYHQSIDTSRAGRWNWSHSLRHHPSNPLPETAYMYSGDSYYPFEHTETEIAMYLKI